MAKPRLPPPAKNQKQPLSIAELGAKAEALEARNDRNGAAQLYRDWIKHSKSPLVWVAQFNLGVLLRNLGDLDGAVEAYKASLAINPKLPHARINLGTVLEVLNRPGEAIDEWKIALGHLDSDPKADPELVCTVLNNLGRRLEVMQDYTEAEEMLTRSLLLKPGQEAVLYHRIFLRQKQCAWPIYAPLPGISLEDQQRATSAVAMLSISDDPELQLRTALSQVPGKIPKDLPKLAPVDGYTHDRLRIGYLSSNFGMHAVSILTAELYELHDRSRVEVWGFCWSPEDNTEMRERVIKAMDHFVRIKDMSDEDAANAIRAAEIDVLIDLQGLTAGCRPKILAYRPAPVQITYLGFPGTTALPEVDYVLADRYIIPEDMARYFTEKPLYLPDCFQVNDRKRISTPALSRAAYGLPEDAFVFCAFNNNIKFTPEFFSAWMRILKRTPHSVLWLLADNERARSNLLRYAQEQGVGSDRLVFGTRVPVADYLARFTVADLFLDLSPFNGGTTAADALWMGLPIITCSGRSFASRMAGSLLQAIGLPELITTSLDDYENLAVAIASDPAQAKKLRSRALENKQTHSLFDTPNLVKHLETLLHEIAIQKPLTSAATPTLDVSQIKPFIEATAIQEKVSTLIDAGQHEEALDLIYRGVSSFYRNPEVVGHALYLRGFDQLISKLAEVLRDTSLKAIPGGTGATLIVLSEFYIVGGHSRVTEDIVDALDGAVVVLTDIFNSYRNGRLKLDDARSRMPKGLVHCLNNATHVGKVKELQSVFKATRPSNVIFMVHHQDPLAFVAAGSLPESVKKIFLHHCDHQPALGNTIAGYRHVDFSQLLENICKANLSSHSDYLPLYVPDLGAKHFAAQIETPINVISSGSSNKFSFEGQFPYHLVLAEILSRCVGNYWHVGPLEPFQTDLINNALLERSVSIDRFHYVSHVPSLWEFLKNVDAHIFLGTFPTHGGRTAIEAQGCGYPTIFFANDEAPPLLRVSDIYAATELGWSTTLDLVQTIRYASAKHCILSKRARKFYEDKFSSHVFLDALRNIVTD